MLNIEKYKDNIITSEYSDITCCVNELLYVKCFGDCAECKKNAMKWLLSEAQILEGAEKRYLRGVIKPFRKEVKSIWKLSYVSEQIVIQMQSGIEIKLPCFKKGTMYQGMEEDKRYTIEELDL